MRQRRKIETILLTTALVLIVAVFVALIFQLITSNNNHIGGNGLPFTELTVTDGENLLEIEGGIDRHQSGMEVLQILDDIQAPVDETTTTTTEAKTTFETSPETTSVPTTMVSTKPTTQTAPPTTGATGTTFRDVDIRYYVLSEDGLNFREKPSLDSAILQKLEYGDAIRVIGLNDQWAKVRLSGLNFGYVSLDFISKYPPYTSTAPTAPPTTQATTRAGQTTGKTTTTAKPTTTTTVKTGQGVDPIKFVLTGTANQIAVQNFNLIKSHGLINKAISSSINRHYENFKDNGDGTITVDGVTFSYIEQYPGRKATHYDGYEVCKQMIARNGKCNLGHTTAVNHNTGSGIPAQRGIVAVGQAEIGIYPRGTVLFVRGYGMAVVADRSGGHFDLCYDAGESWSLTRNNTVAGIYVIARP